MNRFCDTLVDQGPFLKLKSVPGAHRMNPCRFAAELYQERWDSFFCSSFTVLKGRYAWRSFLGSYSVSCSTKGGSPRLHDAELTSAREGLWRLPLPLVERARAM